MSSAADVLGTLNNGGALTSASNALSGVGKNLDTILGAIDMNTPAGTHSAQGVANAASTSGSSILNSFKLFSDPGRFAAFVIGVILIGGGILMFKGSQSVIATAARVAR